jgi:hypothetical protein
LSRQVDRVANEEHHRYWAGLHGGSDPPAPYRKFVKQGLAKPPDLKLARLRDWVYGGEDSLKRMLAIAFGGDEGVNRRRRRRMNPMSVDPGRHRAAVRNVGKQVLWLPQSGGRS